MVAVVSTGPSTFAGAGTAHYRTLQVLADAGFSVSCVVDQEHFQSYRSDYRRIDWIEVNLEFDAYPDSDRALGVAIGEQMVKTSLKHINKGRKVVLLGTYIYPYGEAALRAAQALQTMGQGEKCRLILVPAGSDIWQLGRQMPLMTQKILGDQQISRVVAYSRTFARELQLAGAREISVIPPPLSKALGRPSRSPHLRASLGIDKHLGIILCCCNMRRVKGIPATINLFERAIEFSRREMALLLVGPVEAAVCSYLADNGYDQLEPSTHLHTWYKKGECRICYTGLQKDTMQFHAIADMAINTSYHDSFNISIAESMAHHVPIITSSQAGIAELVRESGCGIVFEYEDTSPLKASAPWNLGRVRRQGEIAREIARIMSSMRLRSSLGQKAAIAINKHCSPERIRLKWMKLVKALLESSPERTHSNP